MRLLREPRTVLIMYACPCYATIFFAIFSHLKVSETRHFWALSTLNWDWCYVGIHTDKTKHVKSIKQKLNCTKIKGHLPEPATPTVAAPAPMNLAAESMSFVTAVVWKDRNAKGACATGTICFCVGTAASGRTRAVLLNTCKLSKLFHYHECDLTL